MVNYQKIYLKGILITLIAIPLLFIFIFDFLYYYDNNEFLIFRKGNLLKPEKKVQFLVQLFLGLVAALIASKLFAKRMVKRPTQLFTNNLLVTLLLWISFMPIGMLDDVFGKSFPIDFESIMFAWLVFGGVLFTTIAVIHAIILYPILIYLRKKWIKKSDKPY